MADTTDGASPKATSSLLGIAVAFVAVSVIAAAAGAGVGWMLGQMIPPPKSLATAQTTTTADPKSDAVKAARGDADKTAKGKKGEKHAAAREASAGQGDDQLPPDEPAVAVALPPIVTNLAGGARWVRMEMSVLLPQRLAGATTLLGEMTEDVLALLRTLTPAALDGPMRFQLLREDVDDVIRIRSQGHARGILIRSFVVE